MSIFDPSPYDMLAHRLIPLYVFVLMGVLLWLGVEAAYRTRDLAHVAPCECAGRVK